MIDYDQIIKVLKYHPTQRTQSDLTMIMEILRKIPFFSNSN